MQKWPYDAASAPIWGLQQVQKDKFEDADAVLGAAAAHARDASTRKRIQEAWVDAFIERGRDLFIAKEGDATRREQKYRHALALFEQAVVRLREVNAPNILADALFGRGRAHDALKQYSAAIEDFREASQLGHYDAGVYQSAKCLDCSGPLRSGYQNLMLPAAWLEALS